MCNQERGSGEKKGFSLVLANHWSYTGIGWQLGLESCAQSITDSLDMADFDPCVKVCLNLDAPAYQLVDEMFPHVTRRLRRYLKEGKAEIIGGTYGQPVGSMIGGESNIRQILVGRETIRQVLDFELKSFLEEEEFTHPQLPQILIGTGYQYASMAQCDTWGKAGNPVLPFNRIRWRGRDGSAIPCTPRSLLYFHPPMVTRDIDYLMSEGGRQDVETMEQRGQPLATVWTEFGWEPKGGLSVNKFDPENYRKLAAACNVEFMTLQDYMAKYTEDDDPEVSLSAEDFKKLLPWGIGGDQFRVNDRQVESLLLTAEKFDAVAVSLGYPSEMNNLEEAWKNLLISQSHDVSLCEYTRWGGGLMPVTDKVLDTHFAPWGTIGYQHLEQAKKAGHQSLAHVLDEIRLQIDTSHHAQGDMALLVFNACEWERTAFVRTGRVYFKENVKKVIVKNKEGAILPSQLLALERDETGNLLFADIGFVAEKLPGMGYDTYYLQTTGEDLKAWEGRAREDEEHYCLENEFVRAAVSKRNGCLVSLVHKASGKEMLDSAACPFPAFSGKPSSLYPEWVRHDPVPDYDSLREKPEVSILLDGPVYTVVKSRYSLKGAVLEVLYSLSASLPGVEVKCRLLAHVPPQAAEGRINGWQLPLEIADGYWFRFAPAFEPVSIFRDYAFGVEETDKAEVQGLTFADILGKESGLLLVHAGTQYFKREGKLISNLVLREWESHFTGQCGWQPYSEYRYLLVPHENALTNCDRLRLSREFDRKPEVVVSDLHTGTLPQTKGFLQMEGHHAMVSSFRKTRKEGFELRLYEAEGENCTPDITFGLPVSSLVETDMLGSGIKDGVAMTGKLDVSLRPWGIHTYRLLK